jgi:hypothetical protein
LYANDLVLQAVSNIELEDHGNKLPEWNGKKWALRKHGEDKDYKMSDRFKPDGGLMKIAKWFFAEANQFD